jgi:uncharacterized protein (TIGR02147 family)
MLSIFDYIDPSLYLKDQYTQKKVNNPAFSLRSFALQLGMKSHGPLHAMMKGERNIPKKLVPLLIKSFQLKAKEKKYFEILVDLQRSKTMIEKDMYLKDLESISPKPLREINDVEAYKFYTNPLHGIISEMVQLKNFKNSVGHIKSRLHAHANLKDIDECIERLISLGILKKEGKSLSRTLEHIYTSKEVLSQAVQEYHRQMSKLAMDSLVEQSLEEREFNGISFNIKSSELPAIKEDLRQMVNDLIQKYEAPSGEGDETYHLNLQLFSLTKSN